MPNLHPTKVTVWFHPDNKQFDATLWINNDGADPALGAFRIDFGYAYYDYSQDPPLYETHERFVETPGATDIQPGGTNPFYFTNIPYVRKSGARSALYTFWAIVDEENQIPESDEGDNMLTQMSALKPPLVPRPQRPLVAVGGG